MHQSKSFISYKRNKKSFTLSVFGFSIVVIYNINILIKKIKLTISSFTLLSKYTLALKLKKVKLTILNSLVKLNMKFTTTLKIPKTLLTYLMKQLIKFSIGIKIPKTTISFMVKLATKLGLWLPKIPKVSFILSPVIAKFIALLTHDPTTLASMDSTSLEDLDYVIS